MQRRRGFVFSLDAFVSFSLIIIAIQSMIIISSAPSGYWHGLLQAEDLAKDTLHVVSSTMAQPGVTVMGEASARIMAGSKFYSGDKIIIMTNQLVPRPYSYSYHYYDLGTHEWVTLYNASTDSDGSDSHFNVTFRRVSASSEQLVLDYASPVIRPQSPYCNVYCRGWDPATNAYTAPHENCVQTPCDAMPTSNFQSGNLTFGLLRLTVWG
jgi:hypothetical protein